jgi:chromosome segregation ATPase
LVPTEHRTNDAFEPTAARIDEVADSLINLELDLDDVVSSGYLLDPVVSQRMKDEIAVVGAKVIEARYEGEEVASDDLMQSMRGIVERLEIELVVAQDKNRTDEAHIGWLQERVQEVSADLHASRADSVVVKEHVSALEAQVFELECAIANTELELTGIRLEEVRELREQAQDFQLGLRDLRFRILAQHKEIEELRVDNDLVRAQLSDTEALLRATHRELVRTRGELNSSSDKVVELAEELQEATAENAVMENWMNNALSRYASLQQQIVATITPMHH